MPPRSHAFHHRTCASFSGNCVTHGDPAPTHTDARAAHTDRDLRSLVHQHTCATVCHIYPCTSQAHRNGHRAPIPNAIPAPGFNRHPHPTDPHPCPGFSEAGHMGSRRYDRI